MQENVRLSETIPLHYNVFHVPVDGLLRFTFCIPLNKPMNNSLNWARASTDWHWQVNDSYSRSSEKKKGKTSTYDGKW